MSAAMIERVCVICNAAFKCWPSLLKRKNGGSCCSINCSIESRSRTLSALSPRVRCQNCGKEFSVKASRQRRHPARFCSKPCAAAGVSAAAAKDLESEFWERLDKNGAIARPGMTPCWLWTGARTAPEPGLGYGILIYKGRPVRAHRFAFFLAHGRWPEPCALHRCDVRLCQNPEHLFEGTPEDNCADRHAKGRDERGEDRHCSKLTEEQVLEVRALAAAGLSYPAIAQRFPVRDHQIRRIALRRSWKHI